MKAAEAETENETDPSERGRLKARHGMYVWVSKFLVRGRCAVQGMDGRLRMETFVLSKCLKEDAERGLGDRSEHVLFLISLALRFT